MKLKDIEIRNSNKRNSICSVRIDDHTDYFKNKNETADFIIGKLGIVEAGNVMSENNLHTDSELKEYMLKYITEMLEHKAENNYEKNVARKLTFYSKNITVNIKPQHAFNDIDDALLSVLRLCKEDNNIYVIDNKSCKLLGSCDNIAVGSLSTQAMQTLTHAMLNKLEELDNYAYDDFEEYLRHKAELATRYAKAITTAFKLNLPESYSSKDLKDIEVENIDNTKSNYYDIAGYDNENFTDVLLTHAYKQLINKLIPSGAVSCRLMKVQPVFDSVDDKMTNFLRFSIERCKEERSITCVNYVVQLFSNDRIQVLSHIKQIDKVPFIISDDDRIAELYINRNNIPTKFDGEHPRFDVFTQPYTPEELDIMLAWCYTVWHPSCNENIMLLLQTSGGNGKTEFWRAMITYWLQRLYGEDLTLRLSLDELKNKDKREPANSRGITNAALTAVDECRSTVTDLIKTYSGSDRISYTSEVKYARAFSTVINTRFLLLSNEQFKIEDASCAFNRRVIVISHFDYDNIYKQLPSTCKSKDFAEEADYFYLRCKDAYERISSKYSNLCAAKNDIETIRKNEEDMTDNSDFEIIYSNIYNTTEHLAGNISLSVNELNDMYSAEASQLGLSDKSVYFFKKWVKENHFKKLNYTTTVRVGKRTERRYVLHELKKEPVAEDVVDTPIPSKTRTTAKFELADEQQPTNKALTALLAVDDIKVKTAVWNVWKSTNTDPNTLTAVQIQEYITDAKNKIAKEKN